MIGSRVLAWTAAGAVAASVLSGCTDVDAGDATTDRQSAQRTPSASASAPAASSPSAEPGQTAPELTAPARRPAALADQLTVAHEVLRDRDASADDVRRAAEFMQVATRSLATRPRSVRRSVTGGLEPGVARSVRAHLVAARGLQALTEPQSRLPKWRIVAPPPAAELRRYYVRAQRRTGVHWSYLASIHLVESRMGRIRGVSTAGAQGPMQFLPSTWAAYGGGGDIQDPADAILAAGRLLRANGARGNIAGAVFSYNHSDAYVRAVLTYADEMRRSPLTYRAYWHWRVLYRHVDGTYLLPVGYPRTKATLVRE